MKKKWCIKTERWVHHRGTEALSFTEKCVHCLGIFFVSLCLRGKKNQDKFTKKNLYSLCVSFASERLCGKKILAP